MALTVLTGTTTASHGLNVLSIRSILITNPIGSDPLAADCLRAIGGEAGANGIARLLQLLAVSEAERKKLKGLL